MIKMFIALKRIFVLCVIVLLSILPAQAAVIEYDCEIDAYSYITVYGALDGDGVFDDLLENISISGTFSVALEDDYSQIQFTNIDVTSTPDSGFIFPEYIALKENIGLNAFYGTMWGPLGMPESELFASVFPDTMAVAIGAINYQPIDGGVKYQAEIFANAIPLPAGLWLLFSGFAGFILARRIKK